MANGKKQYVSMRGVAIDMEAMLAANESLPALSGGSEGVRMNARGDILSNFGKVAVSREQIVRDYYKSNPQGVKQVSLRAPLPDTFESPAEALARLTPKAPVVDEVDAPEGVGKKPRRLVNKED